MNFSERLMLTENERDIMRRQHSPYADWGLFKAVESEFTSKFGNRQGVEPESISVKAFKRAG